MNLVFIYLGEECLVISYSASVLILWSLSLLSSPVCNFTKNLKVVEEDIVMENQITAEKSPEWSHRELTGWVADNQTLFSQINKNKIHNKLQNNISYLGA